MTDQVAAAFAGGESAFAALTERYRRELHVPSTAARWSGRGSTRTSFARAPGLTAPAGQSAGRASTC